MTMATSDASATTHTVPHVESSTESTSVQAPKTFPQSDSTVQKEQVPTIVPAEDTTPKAITSTQSGEQEEKDAPTKEAQADPAEDAEDMLIVVEEQVAPTPPATSTESLPGDQAESDATLQHGESTVSMPTAPVLMEANISLQRSRSETDASFSGAPSVDATNATAEDLSNLREFLSSPLGNNQIVERSPGGRYVRFMEKLGSGASKDVYRAYDTEEGIEVAWNVVHLAGVPKNERNRIVNEVRLLERLHHQNIISFHGSWVNRERQQVNFVTEILSSGTLKSFINKVQVIRWKIAKRWAFQILKGLEYLHSQEPPVIHRDLKCENIFINGTSGDLRIGDLGLSTVHRNGKVLSVLGTPEFMAPDMYEEGSYNEKVDIYAFGMCLLEIFTKEIPYRECNNPAQIYKKVMRGAPPDSLLRLKSTHAREFIELCMGHKNEDGTYNRPSATELLAHPFLIKRANDDDEVEVEPPLQEQSIREGSGSNENPSNVGVAKNNPSACSAQAHMSGPSKEDSPKLPPHEQTNSLDEEESDRFEEMPDSEVNNMRKVKVMMGRGEELKESDDNAKEVKKTKVSGSEIPSNEEIASSSSKQNAQLGESESNQLHYLVAAAVIEEDEQAQFQQPYPDDVLKLVVTLPVEGQTQNVQFDFHLVEDDPIQVAKEMVAELGIPQGAVLEISETISSLARAARTKKHKYNTAQAQRAASHPGHALSHSQSVGSVPSAMTQQQPQHPQGPSNMQHQQQTPQHMSQHSVEYAQPPPSTHQHPPQHHQPQLASGQDQNFQRQIQAQSVPYQEQGHVLQGQQSMGQSGSVSSQMHQLQAPQVALGSGEVDSRQAQFNQTGFQGPPPSLPPNSHLQQGGGLVNGDYHQHLPPDGNAHQTAGYNQLQPPQPLSARSVSNANSQSIPQQTPSHQQGNQSLTDGHQQVPMNAYATVPQGHIQQMQAPAPSVSISNGSQQQGNANYQSGQYDTSNQLPQYQYEQQLQYEQQQQQQHQGQHGHVVQPTVGAHHAMPQSLQAPHPQQQYQTGSQSIAQGYGQPIPQQSLPHGATGPGHAQHLQQHSQNAPQHPPTLQQQPQGVPHHQQLQPTQSLQNQQHQVSMHQQHQQVGHQPGMVHQMQPLQHTPNQAAPGAFLQQHGMLAAAPMLDGSAPGDRAPVGQSKVRSPPSTGVDGIVGTTDRSPADLQGNTAENPPEIQHGSQSDLSVGALGGHPMEIWSDDELVEEEEMCAEELRRLDDDFKKNMMRAKKVFVNRMDNLQRTQVQREAQHKKTLEQHQKDRAAFEKRLQQEEIEQNRRIEQMKKEWDRRREEVKLKQLPEDMEEGTSPLSTPSNEGMIPPEARPAGSHQTPQDGPDPEI